MIFGAIKDAILGSDDKVETEQHTTLSPEQAAASRELLNFFNSRSGNPRNQSAFSGELVAPLSDLENVSLAALEDRARAVATQGDPNIQAASEALIKILETGPTDIEDFVQTNIRAPLREEFERTRSATAGRFADNFFSTDRKNQDAADFENFFQTLAATEADVRLRGRESDRNAILEAIGLAPDLAGAESDVLLDLLDAGSVPREVDTARLLGEFEKFRELHDRRGDLASLIAQFIGIPAVENITNVQEGGAGLLGGFAEGFGRASGKALSGKIF